MAIKVIFITSGTTYTVPADFGSLVSVEVIGGGAGSRRATNGGGSGGGAYSKTVAITGLAANQGCFVSIGAGGTAGTTATPGGVTWFNTSNTAPNFSTTGALARGGLPATGVTGGAGGASGTGTGSTVFSGGAGGSTTGGLNGKGGGGGAGGPGGNGGAGGTNNSINAGGGGGSGGILAGAGGNGANAGASNALGGAGGASTGQTGGNGATASVAANSTTASANGGGGGGGGNAFVNSGAGSAGTYWTATAGGTAGSGGGSGGAASGSASNAGSPGLYGGGAGGSGNTSTGGNGAQGIVVFTYNDTPVSLDRYWVGGNGTWDTSSTTKWSTTSGGAGGASVPTSTNDVFINSSSGSPIITLSGAITAKSITTTGATCTIAGTGTLTVSGNITLSATTTWSATGLLTIGATSTITAGSTTFACSISSAFSVTLGANLTLGTTRTYTFTGGTLNLANFTLSTGLFSSNTGTRVFAFGTGNITTTGSGLAFQVGSTYTYTGTPTVNISNNSATATSIASEFLTEATVFNFNITTGTYTLSLGGAFVTLKSLNFTGFAGTFAPGLVLRLYGSLTLVSGMTYTPGNNSISFLHTSGTATLTSAGKNFYGVNMNGLGGTLQLADNLNVTSNSTSTFTLADGTLNLANNSITTTAFNSNSSTTRVIAFGTSGQINFGSNGVNFTTTTGFSYTGTGAFSSTSTSTSTFIGGGGSFPTLNLGGVNGQLTVQGSNTFTNITNTVQPATLRLSASTTTTVGAFNLNGTAGNLVTLNSVTSGTQATLSKASGTVNSNFLSIRDSNATGGAVWNAGANSINVSNNTGWIFIATSSNYFLLF